jgi:mono/diheme cytochrome c family protein
VSYRDTSRPVPNALVQTEPTIALALKAGEAPHPRLGADGGSVRWEGSLNVARAGNHRFRATVRGEFRLTVGAKDVLSVTVRDPAAALQEGPETHLERGWQPFVAEFTRLPGAARVEVFWESRGFQSEPLPYDRLGHRAAQVPARLTSDAAADRGRFLVEERSCLACHRADDRDRLAAGLTGRPGPDLSRAGGRMAARWIFRWLEAPDRMRSGAVMPRLFASDATGRTERYAVATYLASLSGPVPAGRKGEAARGRRLFASLGCLACHGERTKDERLPSLPLVDLGAKTTPASLASYLLKPLAVDPSGRMPEMLLRQDEAEDLACYLCRDDALAPLPDPPAAQQIVAAFRRVEDRDDELQAFLKLPAGTQLLDLGQRVVIARGCNNCHTIEPDGKPFASVLASTSFQDLKKSEIHARGCLAAAPPGGGAPWFALRPDEREDVRQFLTGGTAGVGSPSPPFAARTALRRFNCLACHVRDGEGGMGAALAEDLRKSAKAESLEAVVPPPLTGVAHKLRTPWLREVLTKATRARPWMSLRMPQFGPANVGKLPEHLAALEGTACDETIHTVPRTEAAVAAGRRLVGKTAFACASCHDLAGTPGSGTRGPDLASMNRRVRYDWYRRWLEQPQRVAPGTLMPSLFTNGRSPLDSVLGGSADAQAEAMWAYLTGVR